ncbi:MAG TPA: hypothetical protein VFH48_05030 [Chloroflexota bacterium]|nr:hypothetical protein [Chloroflexota bacterium]
MDEAHLLAEAIAKAETMVAAAPAEAIIILDGNGHTLYTGAGERDRVSAPVSVLEDSIVIHNHPGGGSLSQQDVRLMLEHEIAQVRAVTLDAVFVLDLPNAVIWDDVAELITVLMDEIREHHRDLILDGKMTYEESEQRRWHEIWTGVAEIRGWAYRMEPRLRR